MTEFEQIARDVVLYLERMPLGHEAAAEVRQMRERLIAASRKC